MSSIRPDFFCKIFKKLVDSFRQFELNPMTAIQLLYSEIRDPFRCACLLHVRSSDVVSGRDYEQGRKLDVLSLCW